MVITITTETIEDAGEEIEEFAEIVELGEQQTVFLRQILLELENFVLRHIAEFRELVLSQFLETHLEAPEEALEDQR